ncbi:hypothetical protein Emtol_2064 [Emticicia oligotrophica DSM 17448]|uniref:Methyltransferase FkbM domain-containing protein n=2 Tax=Emticicia TaxID=312278 RepID=A0ABM5N1D8_EMTOG|nr:hypothetical protein Emtol_2064 [Emticicia oligotrophica DSM 17448]
MSNLSILIEQLKPFNCHDKLRIGSVYDGGYIMPEKTLRDADCLLSFGVSTNIDFEEHFLKLNQSVEIYMYDPFIGFREDFVRLIKRVFKKDETIIKREIKLADNPFYFVKDKGLLRQSVERAFHWIKFYKFIAQNKVFFRKIGLRNYCDSKFTNFQSIFSNDIILSKKSIVLKIDIEGDEYIVFDDLINFVTNISVILFEFHDVKNNYIELTNIIKKLKEIGLYLVHIHGNNSDVLVEGSTIPNTLELTFCKAEYCNYPEIDESKYPVNNLDAPCNPKKVDYMLDFLN